MKIEADLANPKSLQSCARLKAACRSPSYAREHGIATGLILQNAGQVWRPMDASMISQMKSLEDRTPLKKMYAEMSMQAELLKELLGKNDAAIFKRREMAGSKWRCVG